MRWWPHTSRPRVEAIVGRRMPDYRLVMRSVPGGFETSPWGEILNWGRCVKVTSTDDIEAVHRLVAAPGDDRRAVVFEWVNRVKREALIDAIQATGLALRPFDDSDMAVAAGRRPKGSERLLAIPGLPYLAFMRVRGRSTQMYEVTEVPDSAGVTRRLRGRAE